VRDAGFSTSLQKKRKMARKSIEPGKPLEIDPLPKKDTDTILIIDTWPIGVGFNGVSAESRVAPDITLEEVDLGVCDHFGRHQTLPHPRNTNGIVRIGRSGKTVPKKSRSTCRWKPG
jgi:hypothetical protein